MTSCETTDFAVEREAAARHVSERVPDRRQVRREDAVEPFRAPRRNR